MNADVLKLLTLGLKAQYRAETAEKKLKQMEKKLRRTRASFRAELKEMQKKLRAVRTETTRARTKTVVSKEHELMLVNQNETLMTQVKDLEMKLKLRPIVRKKEVVEHLQVVQS